MIITLPYIIGQSFNAVTIYPFIFVKHEKCKSDFVLINHEKIHIKQQKELFWLLFFIWYFVEYLVKLLWYRNTYTAYRSISFEREAYANEYDLDYLQNRKRFAFIKHL